MVDVGIIWRRRRIRRHLLRLIVVLATLFPVTVSDGVLNAAWSQSNTVLAKGGSQRFVVDFGDLIELNDLDMQRLAPAVVLQIGFFAPLMIKDYRSGQLITNAPIIEVTIRADSDGEILGNITTPTNCCGDEFVTVNLSRTLEHEIVAVDIKMKRGEITLHEMRMLAATLSQ